MSKDKFTTLTGHLRNELNELHRYGLPHFDSNGEPIFCSMEERLPYWYDGNDYDDEFGYAPYDGRCAESLANLIMKILMESECSDCGQAVSDYPTFESGNEHRPIQIALAMWVAATRMIGEITANQSHHPIAGATQSELEQRVARCLEEGSRGYKGIQIHDPYGEES
jgi:hypothetical protein